MLKKIILLIIGLYPSLVTASGPGASAAAAAGAGAGRVQTAHSSEADTKKNQDNDIGRYCCKDIKAMCYSPDGKWVAAIFRSSKELFLFSVDTSTGVLTLVENIETQSIPRVPFENSYPELLSFSSDSSLLAVANGVPYGSIDMFLINQNNKPLTRAFNPPLSLDISVASIAFSPDGKLFAVVPPTAGDKLMLFSINHQGVLKPTPNSPYNNTPYGGVRGGAFSNDGAWFVTNTYQSFDHVIGLNSFQIINNDIALVTKEDNGLGNQSMQLAARNFYSEKLLFVPNSRVIILSGADEIKTFLFDEKSGQITLAGGFKDLQHTSQLDTIRDISLTDSIVALSYARRVHILSIDKKTGYLTPVKNSPFEMKLKDNRTIRKIALAPDSSVLAVQEELAESKSCIQLYEFDEDAGTLTRLTGNLLQNKARYEKTALELRQQNIPEDIIGGPLQDYMRGPKPAQLKSQTKNILSTTNKKRDDEISLSKQQNENAVQNSQRLFDAIKQGNNDEAIKLINPFTVNKKDAQNNTPLLAAVSYQRLPIVEYILSYEGIKKYDQEATHDEQVKADLTATNQAGNSVLLLALVTGNYQIALAVLKELRKRHSLTVYEQGQAFAMILVELDKPEITDENKKLLNNLRKLIEEPISKASKYII